MVTLIKEGKSVGDEDKKSAFLQDSSKACEQLKGPLSKQRALGLFVVLAVTVCGFLLSLNATFNKI